MPAQAIIFGSAGDAIQTGKARCKIIRLAPYTLDGLSLDLTQDFETTLIDRVHVFPVGAAIRIDRYRFATVISQIQ